MALVVPFSVFEFIDITMSIENHERFMAPVLKPDQLIEFTS